MLAVWVLSRGLCRQGLPRKPSSLTGLIAFLDQGETSGSFYSACGRGQVWDVVLGFSADDSLCDVGGALSSPRFLVGLLWS